jgi:dienelactone hydrolase
MEGFKRNVDGFYDVEDQLPRYLRDLASEQFKAAENRRRELDSSAAFERYRDRVRSNFLDALGGLPKEKTDLRPVCTGTLERDRYVIEKIVFESRPRFHVTSNLYLPVSAGRDKQVPGVLFFCGHADSGKAASLYQQACIDLACNGFAVLAVDPLGQGERHQSYDPETGITPRRNIIEHTYLGHQCLLAGTNVARYFVWDAIRALDYLLSRGEVDADRVGATGNSGGGLQTAYLMLADDRLASAAPCCFITSREDYMKTGQAQDGEQILYRAIDRGPRYDDFVTALAPKPVLIGATQSDFLCVEGAHRTYERAQVIYDHYGADDAIELTVSDTSHGLTPHLREATVNWFRKHLRGIPDDFETDDPEIEPPEALRVTDGEVVAEYSDERHVIDFVRREVRDRNPENLAVVDGEYSDQIRETLRTRFALDRERVRLSPRTIAREERNGLVREKVFFRSESDIVTTAIVVRTPTFDPEDGLPTVVLLERGTEEIGDYEDDIAQLAEQRGLVMVFDPRGIGGVRARNVNTPLENGGEYYDYHGTEYKLASDALMLGTSLVALRVFDVLRAAEYLHERCGDVDLGIVGAGTGAIHALYAAVAHPSFQSVLVEDVPSFYERATRREITVKHGLNVFDVIGSLDVPQLLPALSGREVVRTDFPNGGFPENRMNSS